MASDNAFRPRPELRASVVGLECVTEASSNSEAKRSDENGKPGDEIVSKIDMNVEIAHGRKTDIFSLGYVFLELLAVLVNENLPMNRDDWNSGYSLKAKQHLPSGGIGADPALTIIDDVMFCECLKGLKTWALSYSTSPKASPNAQSHDSSIAALVPLFDLATRMIASKADDRPSIDEVVHSVADIGEQHFCQSCLAELSTDRKATKMVESLVAHKDRVAKPKRTNSMTPDSPSKGSTKSILKRSATIFRVDSHGPGTSLMKVISR